MVEAGWYGFDLDGTLAKYDHFRGIEHIGEPVEPMLNLLKKYLEEGKSVRIFTARVSPSAILGRTGKKTKEEAEEAIRAVIQPIMDWCLTHIGQMVPITCQKDYNMISLFDDRVVQIVPNEGRRADGLPLE